VDRASSTAFLIAWLEFVAPDTAINPLPGHYLLLDAFGRSATIMAMLEQMDSPPDDGLCLVRMERG
jgi:hypothetical protein